MTQQDWRTREERALAGGEDVQGVPVHAQHDDHLRDAGLGVAAEDDDRRRDDRGGPGRVSQGITDIAASVFDMFLSK